MSSSLCCNPIDVDDEILDMELEEVWEFQRTRSRSHSHDVRTGPQYKKTVGAATRHGRSASLSREPRNAKRSTQIRTMNNRRASSTGRLNEGKPSRSRAKEKRNKSERYGRDRDDRRVSISKYVEKIELKEKNQIPNSKRKSGIAPPMQRTGRPRPHGNHDPYNTRSRSMAEDKNRFNSVPINNNSFDERPRKEETKRRGLFGFRRRKKEKRDDMVHDDWSSSSDASGESSYMDDASSYERGGFFSAFR